MAAAPQLSNEEILTLLSAKAKTDGDSFRMRVYRMRPGSMAEGVVTLDGAGVIHFAAPELWLPRLAGGGPIYKLQAYHHSDVVNMLSQPLTFHIAGAPQPIAFEVVREQNWQGPKQIIWPEQAVDAGPRQFYSIPLPGGIPPLGASTPQTSGPAGGPLAMVQPQSSPQLDAAWAQLNAERAQLEAARRELDEARHRGELERIRQENELRFKELRAEMAAQRAPAAPAESAISPLVPLIQGLISQQQEASKQQTQLLITVLEKKTDDGPSSKMLSGMAESMGAIMKVTTEAVQTLADATLGPKDPPGLMVVKELVKGVNAIASGVGGGKAQPKLRALPSKASPPAAAPAPASPAPPAPAPIPQVAEPVGAPNAVDRIQGMILKQLDVALVASEFLAAIEDPTMVEALEDAGGDPVTLFQKRLAGWVEEAALDRGPYVLALSKELDRQLRESDLPLHDEDEPEDAETAESEAQAPAS